MSLGLESLAQEIPGLATKVCDISQREDIEQMVAFGVEVLGGLDVLVTNKTGRIKPMPVPDMRAILTVLERRTLLYRKGEDQRFDEHGTDLQGPYLMGTHREGVLLGYTSVQGARKLTVEQLCTV